MIRGRRSAPPMSSSRTRAKVLSPMSRLRDDEPWCYPSRVHTTSKRQRGKYCAATG